MPYAAQTKVPISRTKTDIEELCWPSTALSASVTSPKGTARSIAFNMAGRRVQIMLVMPSIDDFARDAPERQTDSGSSAISVGAGLPAALAGVCC